MRRRLVLLTAAAVGGLGLVAFAVPGANAQQACLNVHVQVNDQVIDQNICVPPEGETPELPAPPELPELPPV